MSTLLACAHPGCSPAPTLACLQSVQCRTSAGLAPGLDMLRSSRPIDRLRYQARLIFDKFDLDGDGRLSLAELRTYLQHSQARLGPVDALSQQYAALEAAVAAQPAAAQSADFEQFVDLVRAQVAATQTNQEWVKAQLPPTELRALLWKAALSIPEFAVPLCTFKLLDKEGNGRLRLEDLARAQGIEKQVFDAVLEDADADQDGYLTFEDFLTSYHKDRPVFMSMAVMLAHTACFYIIFQLPIEPMFKVLLSAVLVLRPQLVTAPVKHVWAIGKTIVNRIRATQKMARKGADWSSFA